MRERRAVVIGAGVFGLPASIELRRRGWSVTLLDPGPLPRPVAASTCSSRAVRMDYGGDAFHSELAAQALDGWRRWNTEAGRTLYHPSGFLLMTREPLGRTGFEAEGLALLRERGLPLERMNGGSLERRFPELHPGSHVDGYFNPVAGWADARATMRFLLQQAAAVGVELRPGSEVAELLERGAAVEGVRTVAGERLAGDVTLVAAGAWSSRIVPELAACLRPSGQPLLWFRPDDPRPFRSPGFPVWGADISRTGWYGFPAAADGWVKVGNHGPGMPVDPDGGRELPPEWELRARRFLAGTWPALADAPLVDARLCLYCDSPDGGFWIDRIAGRDRLVVASGGSGHGFKFAPVLGPIVADAVEARPNRNLARFAARPANRRGAEQARWLGTDS